MELQLRDHTEGKLQPSQERLAEKVLAQAAERLDVPEQAEMSLTFVLNPEIRELNRDYRGIDRATAERIVIRGFLGSVLTVIPAKNVRDKLVAVLERKLADGQKY